MARKQKQERGRLEAAAETVGHALGRIARRVDEWKRDRAAITDDINQVIDRAQAMLSDVERTPAPDAIGRMGEIAHVSPATPQRRTPKPRPAAAKKTAAPRPARRRLASPAKRRKTTSS